MQLFVKWGNSENNGEKINNSERKVKRENHHYYFLYFRYIVPYLTSNIFLWYKQAFDFTVIQAENVKVLYEHNLAYL